ncbi:MAG: uridine kinase [Clostridia bacterium]|nr:uridine kinase [Clostridia bacterium]
MQKSIKVIGIAGGSGSGKSTLTKKLQQVFNGNTLVINFDDYYLPRDDMPLEERKKLNYDHPSALDIARLIEHIKALKRGDDVQLPIYDYALHTRSEKSRTVKADKVIIIDGILTFHDKRLRDLMDVKIFVDLDADERILRRLKRDVCERGRTVNEVIEQYLSTVKPMHDKYVEPTKKYADFIIGGNFSCKDVELLEKNILKLI